MNDVLREQSTATLDPSICHRALRSRDSRFDGKFFIAVKTTGVYCRPICPAPTALLKNCHFVVHAAEAEALGYRPCLRCFPEAAPCYRPQPTGQTMLSRAVSQLLDNDNAGESVEGIARSLGISARHLRRLFDLQLGVSPQQFIATRRVQLAKQLIDETALSMTQIAFSAGFPSVRQFNSAIKVLYDQTPSELRKRKARNLATSDKQRLSLKLYYRPPFDWALIQRYLQSRQIRGVEQVDLGVYQRWIVIDEKPQLIRVSQTTQGELHHFLTLTVPIGCADHLCRIVPRVRQLFDLDADPASIAQCLSEDNH